MENRFKKLPFNEKRPGGDTQPYPRHHAIKRIKCRDKPTSADEMLLEKLEHPNRNPASPFSTIYVSGFQASIIWDGCFPVAHAEGRFVIDPELAKKYLEDGLVTLTYKEELNGSIERIAGLRDETGRVFGLMPHPERFIYAEQHYDADWDGDKQYGWGHFFFESIFKEIRGKAPVTG